MSTWTMYALLVFYLILAFAMFEGQWWRAMCCLVAIVISVAVLGMTER